MKVFESIVFAFSESLSGTYSSVQAVLSNKREKMFFYGFSRQFSGRHLLFMFLQPHKALLLCNIIHLADKAHMTNFLLISLCSSQLTGFAT